MKIKEIAFTSYSVTDIKRARKFYEEILGLKPTSVFEGEGMAFIEYEIGPHTFVLGMGAPQFKPGPNGGTVTFELEDFDSAFEELKKNKIKFVMEKYDGPVCQMACIVDPDGNQVMMHRGKK